MSRSLLAFSTSISAPLSLTTLDAKESDMSVRKASIFARVRFRGISLSVGTLKQIEAGEDVGQVEASGGHNTPRTAKDSELIHSEKSTGARSY